jgi:hypothetical protein
MISNFFKKIPNIFHTTFTEKNSWPPATWLHACQAAAPRPPQPDHLLPGHPAAMVLHEVMSMELAPSMERRRIMSRALCPPLLSLARRGVASAGDWSASARRLGSKLGRDFHAQASAIAANFFISSAATVACTPQLQASGA